MGLRSILLWLFVFLIAYGAYEYWDEQQERPFEAQLFDAALADADLIEIQAPASRQPLVLTHTGSRWVASQAKANLPADPQRVEALVATLRSIRSYGIAEYGSRADRADWNPEREWNLRIKTSENTIELHLRDRAPRDSLPHVTAYLRMNDRPEWYAVGPLEVTTLPAAIPDLHDLKLSSFPLNFLPQQLRYVTRDTALSWTRTAAGWTDRLTGAPVPQAEKFITGFADLSGQQPAMYFDETRPERFSQRTMTLYGLRGDSIRLVGWYDKLRPNQYFLQSSQAPRRWVAVDSLWWQRYFTLPR